MLGFIKFTGEHNAKKNFVLWEYIFKDTEFIDYYLYLTKVMWQVRLNRYIGRGKFC